MSKDHSRRARLEDYLRVARALSDALSQGRIEVALEQLQELQSIMAEMNSAADAALALTEEERALVRGALSLVSWSETASREGKERAAEEIEAIAAIRAHLRSAAAEVEGQETASGLDCQV